MAIEISNQYLYTGRGPFDTKSIVAKYDDLLTGSTWLGKNGKSTAYNGMVVAVWKDPTPNKNGIYYLHDGVTTSTFKEIATNNPNNWHKLAELSELSTLQNSLSSLATAVEGAKATAENAQTAATSAQANFANLAELFAQLKDTKADANTVYSKDEINTKFEAVNTKYTDVAALISTNTTNITNLTATVISHNEAIANIDNKINEGIIALLDADEFSVNEQGKYSIKEVNVNKLVQTEGEYMLFNCGNSSKLID
jgi:hypothetical protein